MSLASISASAWSAHHNDFHSVIQLDQDFLHAPWSEKSWSELSSSMLIYLWRESVVRGFALYQLSSDENLAHLLKIVMEPTARGSGTQSFWRAQLEDLKKQKLNRIYLEVAANNAAAIRFYEKSGFKMLRRVRGFYTDGSDALSMELAF